MKPWIRQWTLWNFISVCTENRVNLSVTLRQIATFRSDVYDRIDTRDPRDRAYY